MRATWIWINLLQKKAVITIEIVKRINLTIYYTTSQNILHHQMYADIQFDTSF